MLWVTAGPTYEAIDPVRFIGNHSSGRQGYAVADALVRQALRLFSEGTSALEAPAGVRRIDVTSAGGNAEGVWGSARKDITMRGGGSGFNGCAAFG